MSTELKPENSTGHGDYERSDIGSAGILYFLGGLAASMVLAYFVVVGLYSFLDKRSEAAQTPVNPLVTNAPADTRHIPDKYEEKSFPQPLLEKDERGQLNDIRIKEEQTLSTYDYVDKNAGIVRLPIDRAMELVAQRGLPTRAQGATSVTSAESTAAAAPEKAPTAKPKAKKK